MDLGHVERPASCQVAAASGQAAALEACSLQHKLIAGGAIAGAVAEVAVATNAFLKLKDIDNSIADDMKESKAFIDIYSGKQAPLESNAASIATAFPEASQMEQAANLGAHSSDLNVANTYSDLGAGDSNGGGTINRSIASASSSAVSSRSASSAQSSAENEKAAKGAGMVILGY